MRPPDNRFSTSNLTLFAICAGVVLYFSALLPDLINYATNTTLLGSNRITIALGLLAFILFGMAFLYGKGHKFAINFAIIAMALSTPFVFDPQAFLYGSIPQGIWLPFIFALAVGQFRDAVITLSISLILAFFSYPGALRSPRAIAETLLIFLIVLVGRLVLHRLVCNVIDAQNQNRITSLQAKENKVTSNLIADSMSNGFECGELIYKDDVAVDFIYIKVNDALERIMGCKNIIGKRFSEVLPDEAAGAKERLAVYARVGSTGVTEHIRVYVSRMEKWFQVTVSSNKLDHFIAIFEEDTAHEDATENKLTESDLTEKTKIETERFKFFQAIEHSPSCIMITNLKAEIEYVNAAFLKRTGYSRTEVMGKNPRFLKSEKASKQLYVDIWKTIKQGKTWQGEMSNRTKIGQEYIQFTTISPIRESNGNISHYISNGEDMTERKKGEERIFELAYFDPLTGLPNRTLLLDRLKQVIALSARSGMFNALLFIDLDQFKNINDTLGHQKGDLVLKQVAECLMLKIREGDTVSRFGGDEFIVLLTGLGTDSEVAANRAKTTALKLLGALNQTYQLDDVVHHGTASIGVAMFNGDHVTTDELLKQADLAMYKSKKAGRNALRFFDPSLELATKQQAMMEKDLRIALQKNQFVLHYQGQFTEQSTLTGAEVVVQWEHPQQGMMPPTLFLPFAEEAGLIIPIGNWVLENVCNQLALWGKDPSRHNLILAVNVSPNQFRQSNFIETVSNILKRSGANPQRLQLQLTESIFIENVDDIIQKMLALKEYGVGFSLNDFGTGHSSLSSLKRLPLDQLKLDQSFIRDVHNDPNSAAIATTIVSLGKSLGLNVIAEGVETVEQREFLSNAGCFAYQGHLFGDPLLIHEFEDLANKLQR